MDLITQKDLKMDVRSCPNIQCPIIYVSTVEHYGEADAQREKVKMISRLRKAIIQGHRDAYNTAVNTCKEYQMDYGETVPNDGRHKNLPYPQRIIKQFKVPTPRIGQPTATGKRIISGSKNHQMHWEMVEEHLLWVRVFDIHGDVIYNHANPQRMPASQMIQLCTKLVTHLNMIAKTDEMDIQEALGTLEGTITAQLTPPLDGTATYHAWNLQEPDVYYDVGAIAIIKQIKDNSFKGQLVDDVVGTTFQLQ